MNVSHQKNQQEQFDKHTIVKTKQYRQNSKIYNQYEQLLEEKRRKQLELERKLVDEAASQQLERENRRKSLNEKKKMDLSI